MSTLGSARDDQLHHNSLGTSPATTPSHADEPPSPDSFGIFSSVLDWGQASNPFSPERDDEQNDKNNAPQADDPDSTISHIVLDEDASNEIEDLEPEIIPDAQASALFMRPQSVLLPPLTGARKISTSHTLTAVTGSSLSGPRSVVYLASTAPASQAPNHAVDLLHDPAVSGPIEMRRPNLSRTLTLPSFRNHGKKLKKGQSVAHINIKELHRASLVVDDSDDTARSYSRHNSSATTTSTVHGSPVQSGKSDIECDSVLVGKHSISDDEGHDNDDCAPAAPTEKPSLPNREDSKASSIASLGAQKVQSEQHVKQKEDRPSSAKAPSSASAVAATTSVVAKPAPAAPPPTEQKFVSAASLRPTDDEPPQPGLVNYCRRHYRNLVAKVRYRRAVAAEQERLLYLKEKYVRHPFSSTVLYWDTIIIVLIMYQLLAVPFRAAFDVPAEVGGLVVDGLIDCLFIADVVFQFFVAYEVGADAVANRKLIARRFVASSRFWIDMIACCPLDFMAIHYGPNPLLRLNRIVRFLRYNHYFWKWEQVTALSPTIVKCLQLSVFVALTTHFWCCSYFAILRVVSSDEPNFELWSGILRMDPWAQYSRCLWLTLTSLFGYANLWSPSSQEQTYFALGLMLYGSMAMAIILATAMEMLREKFSTAEEFRKKRETLQQFMKFRALPDKVQSNIVGYYNYLADTRQGIDSSEIFAEIPNQLLKEIAMYMNKDVLQKVPLFRNCPPAFIETIATHLQPLVFMPGWLIIQKGETGKEMFFLSKGRVEVTNEDGSVVFVTLNEGAFFGEVALITSAKRNASIRACSDTVCEVYRLTKEDFDFVLNQFPETKADIEKVAANRSAPQK